MKLEEKLEEFLAKHCPDRPALLLGLSGGPDSTALFHLLVRINYPFEVAHIDHGWRDESARESEILSQLCQETGIAFHLKRLPANTEMKNLEEQGRNARHLFFEKICQERGLKGVLLAHHADDHAETVLKRIFEGASLPKLQGLLPMHALGPLLLFRPLLRTKKKEILKWLEENKINYFQDPTNRDLRFLRSRMREEILPTLSSLFGKEIASNLCKLGETAGELNAYLREESAPYLTEPHSLDFSKQHPASDFLWKSVLRFFFEQHRLTLTQATLDSLLWHLQKGSVKKTLKISSRAVLIDRKKISVH